MVNIGKRIKELLKQHPNFKTQKALADKLGVSPQRAYQIVNSENLHPETKHDLEQAFDLDKGALDLPDEAFWACVTKVDATQISHLFREANSLSLKQAASAYSMKDSFAIRRTSKIKELQFHQHTEIVIEIPVAQIMQKTGMDIKELLVFVEDQENGRGKFQLVCLRPSTSSMTRLGTSPRLVIPDDEGDEPVAVDGTGKQHLLVLGIPRKLASTGAVIALSEQVESEEESDYLSPKTVKLLTSFIQSNSAHLLKLKRTFHVN